MPVAHTFPYLGWEPYLMPPPPPYIPLYPLHTWDLVAFRPRTPIRSGRFSGDTHLHIHLHSTLPFFFPCYWLTVVFSVSRQGYCQTLNEN